MRLVIPLYVYGYPSNFIQMEPNYQFCFTLSFWVLLQMAVILGQHYCGPRYFVPAIFLPKKYDYFRPFRPDNNDNDNDDDDDDDIEKGKIRHHTECVICMCDIDLSKVKSRMVTPCNHAFHAECLQKWMEVKLECPTCMFVYLSLLVSL